MTLCIWQSVLRLMDTLSSLLVILRGQFYIADRTGSNVVDNTLDYQSRDRKTDPLLSQSVR